MIGDVLYTLLITDTDVSALVSTRVYQDIAVESVVYPYIVLEQVGNDPLDEKDGKSPLDTLTWDVMIYSKTKNESDDLGVKVRNLLDRYSGTVVGKVIQSTQYNGEDDEYDDDDRVYLKGQNYQFRYYTIYATLDKPTNLVQTSNTTTSILLGWDDNATGETGYEVWRSADFISWTLISTEASNATSYDNTGLSSDTPYAYKVRAINAQGGGEWSNVIVANTETNGSCPTDIFLKFHWDASNDTTDTAIIDSDSAGVYTSISDDGSSGTVTVSVNGGALVAFSTLNPLTLIATDTIAFFRTVTTGAGWSKLTGTY